MMYAFETLLCGLQDGRIFAFMKDGQRVTLQGHGKRVSAMLLHQNVLITGSHDGSVKLWQPNPPNGFACSHTLTDGIPGNVTCMEVLGDHLMVGGNAGMCAINLQTLQCVKKMGSKQEGAVCDFLMYLGHLIVGFTDGSVKVLDTGGAEKHSAPPMPTGQMRCLAGLECGPRLLVGHQKGQLTSISLPDMNPKAAWRATERCDIECIRGTSFDGIFLLGLQNGDLQLWQRVAEPAAAAAGAVNSADL